MANVIDSLGRGVDVLTVLLMPRGVSGTTLRDLHAETGVPKASLSDILHTLRERGLVTRDDAGLWRIDRRWLGRPVTYAAHLAHVEGLTRHA